MRFASYLDAAGRPAFGALSADGLQLGDLRSPGVPDLRSALATWGLRGLQERARDAAPACALAGVTLLPPVPQPGKILCVGLNYADHAAEAARTQAQHPSLFVRFPETFVGHAQPVRMPAQSQAFDYEAELAVVVGAPLHDATPRQAMAAVAGYACMAENSVRDFQKHAAQVTAGKNFWRSGAWGPWLATADEAGDPRELEVIGRLNGEVVQRDRIAHLVHPVGELLAYISSFVPLAPGDVIATGTPAGVGALRNPPLYMQPGDLFEVEIPRVGLLANRVQAATPSHPTWN